MGTGDCDAGFTKTFRWRGCRPVRARRRSDISRIRLIDDPLLVGPFDHGWKLRTSVEPSACVAGGAL